jgi:hypothetical protein
MKMKRMQKFAGLIACGTLIWAGPVFADAVTDWNEIANGAVAVGRPGPVGTLDLALVSVAMHDAVQAIDKRFEPYFAEVPGAKGSRSAAAAAAAHGVLVGFYPDQAVTLDATYFAYLSDNGLTGNAGLSVGEQVAAAILPLRRPPPDPAAPPFLGGTDPGDWRPTPPGLAAMAFTILAETDPLTLTGIARFRAVPPPALTSDVYTRDYNEVKALGASVNSTRTAEQTDQAHFWSENFVAQWNRAIRAIVAQHVPDIGDRARLFALANLAMADAAITAWDSKLFYNFWRPITAIQEGENDGNPATAGDPTWLSLINNPPYPDYTSGANNLTGAVTRTLALFFGTENMTFTVTSNAPLAVKKSRTFGSFKNAAQQVVNARIYLGIHFRFADEVARTQGRDVAEYVFDHSLLPVN